MPPLNVTDNLQLARREYAILLKGERDPIRNLATILESITDAGSLTHDVNTLTETARNALGRTISTSLANSNGELAVLTRALRLEQ